MPLKYLCLWFFFSATYLLSNFPKSTIYWSVITFALLWSRWIVDQSMQMCILAAQFSVVNSLLICCYWWIEILVFSWCTGCSRCACAVSNLPCSWIFALPTCYLTFMKCWPIASESLPAGEYVTLYQICMFSFSAVKFKKTFFLRGCSSPPYVFKEQRRQTAFCIRIT